MNRNAGLLLKNSREMKWRCVNSARDLIERDTLTHPRREVRLRGLSTFSVIGVCTFAFRLMLDTTMHERGLKHIGDKLERRNISPQRLERIRFRRFETLHQFAMTPEHVAVARPGKEPERLIGVFVD
jgi:hypothetical protein